MSINHSDTLNLAMELISRPSVTPMDAGCQSLLADRLSNIGFAIEPLHFGEVDNLWARRGTQSPLFVFAGHTDVVPSGAEDAWRYPPFTPTCHGGLLYGRGAADMKGSLAAMITACERFVARCPAHAGSIALLLTSDEEGPAKDGTVKVISHLQARNEQIDWCLVGEPSSSHQVGDVVKYGRRGSLSGHLTVQGVQGHVAYPHLADNPVHRFAPVLQRLCETVWDEGNAHFPPTTFQISNLHAGTGAGNVIPGTLEVQFNFRYSPCVSHQILKSSVIQLLDEAKLRYTLDWQHSGRPFLTEHGDLLEAVTTSIRQCCDYSPQLSTAGGTSDGRFIAPAGAQVLELGPVNATIHKIDECISVQDLETLSVIYEQILDILLGNQA